ncbi:MBL fold metallo-hydrolase [Myxococcota bacterium]|nr:MBL fold metallo-hydrolase [Myxococcota bacterium]MBU1430471.1 MBL fold metallo-hydrolase [Myxococcota bacterium]MBU1898827.1 MBL fold metallo-hydrolase [Myxococcota bacterium]
MNVKFWGVRGSIAVSGAERQTGGNTTCVEISSGGHRLILDGGTGLRALGEEIGFTPLTATLLFTHLHWDHIQGVPFFSPAFHPGSNLTLVGVGGLRETLSMQMRPPTFPVGLDALKGAAAYWDVRPGSPFEVGPFRIRPIAQAHPDGVVAYRIEADNRSVVFATDVEHDEDSARQLIDLSEGCDLLIHDAQYTLDEYEGRVGPSRVGWGHSAWPVAVELARCAHAKRLALFHHDPSRVDKDINAMERDAQALFSGTFAAREGQALAL